VRGPASVHSRRRDARAPTADAAPAEARGRARGTPGTRHPTPAPESPDVHITLTNESKESASDIRKCYSGKSVATCVVAKIYRPIFFIVSTHSLFSKNA